MTIDITSITIWLLAISGISNIALFLLFCFGRSGR